MNDNSRHHKIDCHAVLMSAITDGVPSFKLFTTSALKTKDSDGNEEMNLLMLAEKIPILALAHYGGNVSDNAREAILEGQKYFLLVMQKIEN